jgi:hypothetical protein
MNEAVFLGRAGRRKVQTALFVLASPIAWGAPMADAPELSPAEKVVLLSPNGARGFAAIKATLLLLLTKGVLRIEESTQYGLLRTKTVAHLRIANEPKAPPPEVGVLIDIIRDAQAAGGRIKDVLALANKKFLNGCPKYIVDIIQPALIARGLLTKKKTLFIYTFHLTPEGEALHSKLKSDLYRANDIPKLLKSDPAQAAAVAAAIGTTIFLSDKLPQHFKALSDAMRAQGSTYMPIPDSGNSSGFDLSSFDLGSFDFASFDAGGFDTGMASFDAGFSDAGGGGGDSGGGADSSS